MAIKSKVTIVNSPSANQCPVHPAQDMIDCYKKNGHWPKQTSGPLGAKVNNWRTNNGKALPEVAKGIFEKEDLLDQFLLGR